MYVQKVYFSIIFEQILMTQIFKGYVEKYGSHNISTIFNNNICTSIFQRICTKICFFL